MEWETLKLKISSSPSLKFRGKFFQSESLSFSLSLTVSLPGSRTLSPSLSLSLSLSPSLLALFSHLVLPALFALNVQMILRPRNFGSRPHGLRVNFCRALALFVASNLPLPASYFRLNTEQGKYAQSETDHEERETETEAETK